MQRADHRRAVIDLTQRSRSLCIASLTVPTIAVKQVDVVNRDAESISDLVG